VLSLRVNRRMNLTAFFRGSDFPDLRLDQKVDDLRFICLGYSCKLNRFLLRPEASIYVFGTEASCYLSYEYLLDKGIFMTFDASLLKLKYYWRYDYNNWSDKVLDLQFKPYLAIELNKLF
jgi:hypothetical protein